LIIEPKASDSDSFSAPDWPWYSRGGVLGDPVRQFVADHVERTGEVGEHQPVAVSEDHFLPVPEGVVVAHSTMDISMQSHAPVVDRVTAEHIAIEITNNAESVVSAVD
jgi:hypothetical protein